MTPITKSIFSTRTYNILEKLKVSNVEDLRSFSEIDLLGIAKVGRKTLREIKEVTSGYGVSLRGNRVPSESERKMAFNAKQQEKTRNMIAGYERTIKRLREELSSLIDEEHALRDEQS